MSETAAFRLPASAVTSVLLHGGFLLAYLQLSPQARKESLRVISNVDLLVQVRKPVALPEARPRAAALPPSTWNFLKMALPDIPKPALPQNLEVKLPEVKRTLLKEPEKLQDMGRRDVKPKLEALDLGSRRVEAAKIEESLIERRAPALAQLPALEEVGTRRVKNLPQALALEESRREAVQLRNLEQAVGPSRRIPAAAMAVLREATPVERARLGDKMPALLPAPERLVLRPQTEAAPAPKPAFKPAPPPEPRRQAAQVQEAANKKSVEIEGPLADRKIVAYRLPEFPAWAREQGILEAAVSIRFWVSPDGRVLDGQRVESTSGYGRLDRLAMESLKVWRFESLSALEKQWGVITFRFVME